MNICVIGGGDGPEREVSLRSSAAVRDGLTNLGHHVTFLDYHEDENSVRDASTGCNLVFPILHGRGGEDGHVQAVLDSIGIPYLGSRVQASKLCFNKVDLKELLVANGILTPRSEVVTSATFSQSALIRHPFVLKPVSDGSSVGTMIAHQVPYDSAKAAELLEMHGEMLLEEMIVGHEITVSVLGNKALPVIEIIPPAGQDFDYVNKYNGATSELCPPRNVSQKMQAQASDLALRIHALAGVRHLSRSDFIIDEHDRIYALEINTLPGMTTQSLFPKSAATAGITWTQLVEKLVELAAATS